MQNECKSMGIGVSDDAFKLEQIRSILKKNGLSLMQKF